MIARHLKSGLRDLHETLRHQWGALIMGRRPNTCGEEAKYVVRIQISSTDENRVLEAARVVVDTLLKRFPGEEGKGKAATAFGNSG